MGIMIHTLTTTTKRNDNTNNRELSISLCSCECITYANTLYIYINVYIFCFYSADSSALMRAMRAPGTHPGGWCPEANATILCQDCSEKTDRSVPEIAHQPHEAVSCSAPPPKRNRGPQAAALEARPLVNSPSWTPAFPRQEGL